MKKGKIQKLIAVGLLLILSFGIIPANTQTVYAKTNSAKYIELKNAIEKQYGIKIKLSSEITKNDREAYYDLLILREALIMMPDGLIKTLVKHFKAKGKETTVAIYKKELTFGSVVGTYDDKTNTITLYDQKAAVSIVGSGVEPYYILHEFGHMVHSALYDIYGYSKLKSEFTKLNGNIKYGSNWDSGYDLVFTRSFAITSFAEDFAETFSASLCDSKMLHYIYEENKNAPIIKKSEYIKNIIETKLKVKNINDAWMIYPQTPSKKYAEVINDSYYNYTGTYQYKIKKAAFYQFLCDLWKESKLQKYNNDDWDKKLQLEYEAQLEFDDIIETSKADWEGFIKRKDMALILAKIMDKAQVDYVTVNKFDCEDCNELSGKYMKSIKKVVKAGLMLPKKSNNFKPESYCTYEEAYYALIKLKEIMLNYN